MAAINVIKYFNAVNATLPSEISQMAPTLSIPVSTLTLVASP